MKMIAAIALALLVAASGKAFGQSYGYSYDNAPHEITQTAGHDPLTDANGMTLYLWVGDATGDGVGGIWHIAN